MMFRKKEVTEPFTIEAEDLDKRIEDAVKRVLESQKREEERVKKIYKQQEVAIADAREFEARLKLSKQIGRVDDQEELAIDILKSMAPLASSKLSPPLYPGYIKRCIEDLSGLYEEERDKLRAEHEAKLKGE